MAVRGARLRVLEGALNRHLLRVTNVLRTTIFLRGVRRTLLSLNRVRLIFLSSITIRRRLVIRRNLCRVTCIEVLLDRNLIRFLYRDVAVPATHEGTTILRRPNIIRHSVVNARRGRVVSLTRLLVRVEGRVNCHLIRSRVDVLNFCHVDSRLVASVVHTKTACDRRINFVVYARLLSVCHDLHRICHRQVTREDLTSCTMAVFLVGDQRVRQRHDVRTLTSSVLVLVLVFHALCMDVLEVRHIPFFQRVAL